MPIQNCLHKGQELVVQVTKEGINTKGPTLSTYLALPGKYLVMMPWMRKHGVSHKIEDEFSSVSSVFSEFFHPAFEMRLLLGRVGRGGDQSYCVLMSSFKLSADARVRLETMVRTNDGFEIADTDLKLRGPGDLMGTQQSGVLDLKIADLGKDGAILQLAREKAYELLAEDPELVNPDNQKLKVKLALLTSTSVKWSSIS